jgi:hypothetical protein
VLRFEVAAETFALFREAMTELRRRTGAMLDDDSALLSMARQVLGAPLEKGRATYQIPLYVCPSCGTAEQQAGGELVPVSSDILEMARCDSQRLGYVNIPAANENAEGAQAAERAELSNESRTETERAGAHASFIATAHRNVTHVGAEVQVDNVHGSARPGDDVHGKAGLDMADLLVGAVPPKVHAHDCARPRASQSISPSLRRAVLRRDHERCQVPGCTNSTFVDVHHITLRSEGGKNAPENLITICTVHHRAAHRGELVILRSGAGLLFRHADGSDYGHTVTPRAADTHAKVFSALRNLGFREKEVHAVLAELRRQSGLRDAPTDQLLREALYCLGSPGVRTTKRSIH